MSFSLSIVLKSQAQACCKCCIPASSQLVLWWMCDSPRTGCAWRTTPMWREQAGIRWARSGIFISAWCDSVNLCTLAARPFQSQQSGALTWMWRWCQVQPLQKERATGVVHCKNEGMLLQLLSWRCIESVVFACPITKLTRDEHVLGFKSCDISIYWWIWMLSFLLKQIGIGIVCFLFELLRNFPFSFETADYCNFRFSLGLQMTVGLQVNTRLQPPAHWETFVAGRMLRRPEPTKEGVELTILSIIAIEIRHLTMFAPAMLLRILRYMWRNHVATRA